MQYIMEGEKREFFIYAFRGKSFTVPETVV